MTVPQDLFREALLDPAKPVPDGLSDGTARPAGCRFNVYRNNVAVSLTDAMRTAFPVITKLLGQQNMDGLAGIYLRAHPPATPLMMFYGEAFPEFLAATPQLAHLGYLPDVARLELAMRASYHAADVAPIDPDVLAQLAPDTLAASRLGYAPAVKLIRSDWPIFDIWRFNTQDDAPKPTPGAQDVIVTRPEFDPLPHALPTGGGDWVAATQTGQTFGDAHAATVQSHPAFDLGTTLAVLLQGQAITSLTQESQ